MGDVLELGQTVKDIVTGFTGVVTACCKYMHDTTNYRVECFSDDGLRCEWFPGGRLVLLE